MIKLSKRPSLAKVCLVVVLFMLLSRLQYAQWLFYPEEDQAPKVICFQVLFHHDLIHLALLKGCC